MQSDSLNTVWAAIAASADGTRMVAVQGYPGQGSIYTSADEGVTWSMNNSPSLFWDGVASSADGTKLVAVSHSGEIYTCTDPGGNWYAQLAPFLTWTSVASSADGTKLVAVAYGGGIYTSTNSGTNWNATSAANNYWDSVASAADGSKLVAVGDGEAGPRCPIYTSTNSGSTWLPNNTPDSLYWSAVTSSADGNSLAAALYGGSIFTLQTTPSPQLSLVSVGNSLEMSWLIPSTDFMVQQSSDLISWSELTNPPTLNLTNLQNQIMLSESTSNGFFRLAAP